jgi:hypothetical protein
MAYDNLAGVVIQALRYVTNMGFDVLVYIILDAFANPHKERVKEDGVNTSDWLQSETLRHERFHVLTLFQAWHLLPACSFAGIVPT